MRDMKLPYSWRQGIAVEAAATSGCLVPGFLAAWLYADAYSAQAAREACLAAPFVVTIAFIVSTIALRLIETPAPELMKLTGGGPLSVLSLTWLAATHSAPAAVLFQAFAGIGSLIAARMWASSARR